jgi:HD-GYP domain-containing protein (c-di-GMP phosphodiesterase class II)
VAHAAGIEVDPQIEFGFLLHDIGKLSVPDALLFKPGPLSDEERALVRRHPEEGAEILHHIDFLDEAKSVVRHHHERWDGDGYPDGLAGDEIPIGSRIILACDAYNAMITERPYREPMSPEAAVCELEDHAGTQFDPQVIAALLAVLADRLPVARSA